MEASDLKWSAQFAVVPAHSPETLPRGDKIVLPPSALEQLLAAAERQSSAGFDPRDSQLPQPLTLRLVNPTNNRVVYCGIMEFSAQDGQVVVSQFIAHALGMTLDDKNGQDEDTSKFLITAHAKQLPKGTYVKLRPLESYGLEDWKPLLEEHLRKQFTTLTRGEILRVPATRGTSAKAQDFEFLVDELLPQGDGICIVDTDLEVDIEALNEDQARETVRKIAENAKKISGNPEGSSPGGVIDLFKSQSGRVLKGHYVDYEIPSWDRSQGLEVELHASEDDAELDLFASPFGPTQRAKPRDDENVWSDMSPGPSKRIKLFHSNEDLSKAETLFLSVHFPSFSESSSSPFSDYTIRAMPATLVEKSNGETQVEILDAGDELCKNCRRAVPRARLVLHENFCIRNNILCPEGCRSVFQKDSLEWEKHWHCSKCDSFGNNGSESRLKHDRVFHTSHTCPGCDFEAPSLSGLAHHRSSTCKSKLILCRFCHLSVPQGSFDETSGAEALLSGLTPHEFLDSARTTECHLCQRIVRLRDMDIHLKNHDQDRKSRSTPRVCKNVNCGRTLDGASRNGDTRSSAQPGNDIGLCNVCFGPLYVSTYDPDGKALKRRVERKYLSQLLTGCLKVHCHNPFCKTGRNNTGVADGTSTSITTKDALPMVKPFVDGLFSGTTPLHFCADEASQKRRAIAEVLVAEGSGIPGAQEYGFAWCVAALEAESGNVDKAREWIRNFAPSTSEEQGKTPNRN